MASGDVAVVEQSEAVDPSTLQLRDFHALRAIAARLGWLAEEPIHIQCHNCGEPMRHVPCAHLELGPFLDGELHDPELDATLDLSVAHPVPEVTLPDGCAAREVTLAPITGAEARPSSQSAPPPTSRPHPSSRSRHGDRRLGGGA